MKQFEQKVSDIIDTMHILYDEFNVNKLQLIKTEWKLYEPYYYLLEHDLFFNHILTENTGICIKPEYVIKFLKSKFKLKNWQFEKDIFNNVDSIVATYTEIYDEYDKNSVYKKKINDGNAIILNIPNIKNNKEVIKKTLNRFGYYLGSCSHFDAYHHDWIVMVFHAIYSDNVNAIVFKHKFIYHITKECNKESILKNGFIPQSSNKHFNYPNRCHFFVCDKDEAKLFIYDFTNDQNEKYVLFTLDTSKIDKNINFYPDPNLQDAVITKVPVSKDAIINVEKI